MDHQAIIARSKLECMLFDENVEPMPLPLSLLEDITSSFSEDQAIGYGGFAVVYKGMLDNGTVAVKKLFETFCIDEKQFSEEIHCLMKAKHKNIVRFLGYCSNAQGEMVDYKGKLVLADVRERLLCFEYLRNGSLDKKITDASCGLEWRQRYQIIIGICNGLYYLHQKHIVHLDLKPENILLDDHMMPKITDFGVSRCFDEKQTRTVASKLIGTMGYLAPEFFGGRQITFKSDIYSLGIIIIDILTGEKGYVDVENVLERWRYRLEKSHGDTQLVQVRVCTEIAIECCDFNPAKRPDMQDIIDRLGATQNVDEFSTETGASSNSSVPKAAGSWKGGGPGHWIQLAQHQVVPRSLKSQEGTVIDEARPDVLQEGTVIDEARPDVLRTAVMNVPGFPAEALRVAVSHLENTYQASAYLSMREEHRVLWLKSFLTKYFAE